MMNKTAIWNQVVEAMTAFAPFYRKEAMADFCAVNGCHSWLPFLKTAGMTPAPFTAQQFTAATPYAASRQRSAILDGAMQRGLLSADRPGSYRLTTQGKNALAAFFDSAQTAIAAAPVLPQAEMEELAGLLERIVLTADRLALPRSKANFESSRWTNPGRQAPASVRVDQYMTDLVHFREDAHLASWKAYGIDGRTWETFTYIWRDQANTAADLARKLGRRGYDEADYEAAIRQLLDKGWIEHAAGRWQISGNGRALRDVAEMVTNRLFFAAWQTLSEIELCRLNELLANLSLSLNEAQPAALPA